MGKELFFEFNENQKENVRKELGYNSDEEVDKALDTLEDWISKQSHFVVKKFDRQYLERHLMASKGSLERLKKHLDKLCTFRTLLPEYLVDMDVEKDFQDYLSLGYNGILPKPTPEHYRVCFSKFYTENYDKFSVVDFYKYMNLIVHYILHYDYCIGTVMIIDFQHVNMSLLTKVNPVIIQRGRSIIIDGFGMRLKGIYIINSSKFLESLVSLIKQGLTAKLRDRLHVLSDPESLHKFFPKRILPSDYGGEEKSLAEIHEITFKAFKSEGNIKKMKEADKAKTDEAFRDSTKFSEEMLGMPGSFKMLSVD